MNSYGRKLASGSNPSVKEYNKWFVAVAGDNCAEGVVSALKGQMRRVGNVGRFGSAVATERKSVQAMSAADRLRNPGFLGILSAMAQYRDHCTRGLVQVAPSKAFDTDSSRQWLFE